MLYTLQTANVHQFVRPAEEDELAQEYGSLRVYPVKVIQYSKYLGLF